MAIKKKKTATAVQKSKSKAAPKKSVPIKKVAAKKIATPAKKVVAKKIATKKTPVKTATVAKKAPVKKVAIKKVAAKKVLPAKKSVVKKAAPAKKIVAKKALPQKKAALKLSPDKKNSKPIIKNLPVKNTAKAGVKKAAPKKLATQKKESLKKPVSSVKKTAPKVAASKPTAVAKAKPADKIVEKVSLPKTVSDHQADLKKALSKVKMKNKENQKPEKPFVMPKTNTEKARKYEPEFTKSVLDQANEEYNGPTMRYSDSELVEFRELIMRKLETAKKELGYLQGLITRKDQMGGDDSDNRYMTMEDGSLSMEREQLSQMASRQITFIDHLEKAMMRIENKTYGICRVTGKLIDKARLRAVPHATLSIEAKMGISR